MSRAIELCRGGATVIKYQYIDDEMLRTMYPAKGKNTIISRAAIEDEIMAWPERYPNLAMKSLD